jgi:hypothetical protein
MASVRAASSSPSTARMTGGGCASSATLISDPAARDSSATFDSSSQP